MLQSNPVKPTGQTQLTIPAEFIIHPAFGAQKLQISEK